MFSAKPDLPPIPSLTGLRFAAAACVIWTHMIGYLRDDGYGFDHAGRVSVVGMTLFFVLSGFVIQYNYGTAIASRQPAAVRRFGVARLARLYPLYIVVLGLDLIVRGRHPHELDTFASVWPLYLTLTQSWFPGHVDGTDLATRYIGIAWSISTEILLYLFFLGIARPIAALGGGRATRWAIAWVVTGATAFYGALAMGWWTSQIDMHWALYLSPYCRLAEFSLGALTAALFRHDVRERPAGRLGAGGMALLGGSLAWVVILYAMGFDTRAATLQSSWGFAPGLAGLLYFFARYRSRASGLVENRVVVALGDASYSLYLLHTFAFGAVRHLFDVTSGPQEGLRMAVSWAATIGLSLACYRLYEVPARMRVRRMLGEPTRRVLHSGAGEIAVASVADEREESP